MLSWMWKRILSHDLTWRIAAHTWLSGPTLLQLVLCFKSREQSSSETEDNRPFLLRFPLCMTYLVISRHWQGRTYPHIFNLQEAKESRKVIMILQNLNIQQKKKIEEAISKEFFQVVKFLIKTIF